MIPDIDDPAGRTAWTTYHDLLGTWMADEPVDLLGLVPPTGDTGELFVVAESDDDNDDPDVWLIPTDGTIIPANSDTYTPRPLSEVGGFQAAVTVTSYARAWDLVDDTYADPDWTPASS